MCPEILIRITTISSYLDREGDQMNRQNKFLNSTEFSICKGIEKGKKAEESKS